MNTQIKSQIERAKNILLISHRNPDGDTLGSSCAFLIYLKKIKKPVTAFCVDKIPAELQFLPNTNDFLIGKENLNFTKYDLIITNDCGDTKQTGIADLLLQKSDTTTLINIDHHQTNDNYGDINIVKPEASSTSEIVFGIFKDNNFALNKDITNCLLTGILTDTTYFSNAATTIQAVSSASALLSNGASIKNITQNIYRNKTLQILKLWGKIFDRLIYDKKLQTATAIITQNDLESLNLEGSAIEGISNFLTNLQDAKIILVLWQKEVNIIKGSLRTTCDDIDVSKIAQAMGGGGHKKAAGFSITGTVRFNINKWWIED